MYIRFANPEYLILFVPLALLAYWFFKKQRGKGGAIRFSHLGYLKDVTPRTGPQARIFLSAFRFLAITLLVLAFARPQSGVKGEEVLTEGIDIVLAMDVSSTMLAEDIKPNRVDATRDVAKEFIRNRKNDRIGLVVFAGEAYTQCPLTLDYGILMGFLDQIHVGMIEDGTAIGMGLSTAVNRLRSSEAKSKVILLLTDGQNNRGEIDPITAAQMAQAFDIRVYTIGAGTRGIALYPVEDPFFGKRYQPMQVNIDEETLQRIARQTGGKYFRATDRRSLESVYREIDKLEKTEIKVKEYTRYSELFPYLVFAALALILAEVGLANTRFRKIP
jgi:Ca-activated chloride channel family protein